MHELQRGSLALSVVLGVPLAGPSAIRAESPQPATGAACATMVHLTEAAERKLGGALYRDPMEGTAAMPGMTTAMPEMPVAMPRMGGAHQMHLGQQGGVFFTSRSSAHAAPMTSSASPAA